MIDAKTTTVAESTPPSPTADLPGLTHDLRNLLTVIACGLQLAREATTETERQQALGVVLAKPRRVGA